MVLNGRGGSRPPFRTICALSPVPALVPKPSSMTLKKKVLLINPWVYSLRFSMKPLSLLYAAALLEQYTSFDVSFIDCLDHHHPGLTNKRKPRSDGRGPFFKEEVTKPSILRTVPRKYSRYGIPLSLFRHKTCVMHGFNCNLFATQPGKRSPEGWADKTCRRGG